MVGENDLATTNPKLAAEWDYEANGDLKPTDVTAGSRKKVGWVCSKGHRWNAIIHSRNKGSGCPYCAGWTEKGLVSTNPKLAAEWDYEANGDLKPTDVTAGSSKKVGWICSKGHRWNAVISNRSRGRGCPYCAGRKIMVGENDLATVNPKLAEEWGYEANGNLKPTDVTAGSNKKVGWVCSKGHKWNAVISNRNNGNGCPYCSRKRKKGRKKLNED